MDIFTPPSDYVEVKLPDGFIPSMVGGMLADSIFLPPEHAIAFKRSIGLLTPKQETKELETELFRTGKIPLDTNVF